MAQEHIVNGIRLIIPGGSFPPVKDIPMLEPMDVASCCQFASEHPVVDWPEEVFLKGIFRTVIMRPGELVRVALVRLGHYESISQARAGIRQGAVRLNDRKLDDGDAVLKVEDARFERYVMLAKGRKGYALVVLEL